MHVGGGARRRAPQPCPAAGSDQPLHEREQLVQGRVDDQDAAGRVLDGGAGTERGGDAVVTDDGPGAGELARGKADRRPVEPVTPAVGDVLGDLFDPVAVPLERVGGQLDSLAAAGHGGPVHRTAPRPQRPDGPQRASYLVEIPALGGHAPVDEGAQRRVRPDLDDVCRVQPPGAVGEPDGAAHVVDPVPGLGGVPIPRDPQETDLGGTTVHTVHTGPELVQYAVHVGGVERVTHIEQRRLDPTRLVVRDQRLHRVGVAGHHHRLRRVHRRQLHPLRQLHLGLRHTDRGHRPTGVDRAHQRTALHHQPRRILQREHPRSPRRRDLPHRMPHHHIRHHTPRPQKPHQRHLERENPRLRKPRLPETRPTRDLLPHLSRKQRQHLVPRGREHRKRRSQPTTHPHPLRTLTREHERHASRVRGSPHGRRQVTRDSVQPGQQLVGRLPHHDGPLLERGSRRQRNRHVRRGESLPQPGQQRRRLPAQGRLRPRREGPRHDPARGPVVDRGLRRGLDRGLFQDDVGVGPADAEGGHARAAGPVGLGPRAGVGQQFHGTCRPVDLGGGGVDVQGSGQDAVPQRHDHLQHSRDARGGLGVPEVGLDGTQLQRGLAVLPVGGEQGLSLDRVAQARAGAVRLDGIHVGRGEAGVVQGLEHDALLRGAVRCGQAVGRTVLVDGRAAYHGENLVAVAPGVGEAFEQQHAGALAPARAVGGVGEGAAAAVAGHALLPGELDEQRRSGHDRGPTRQRERALPRAQRLHGQVQRHQRRRAGGVDGDGRALQAQGVGDAAGDHAGGVAGEQVPVDGVPGLDDQAGVVLPVGADVDAGIGAAQ